MHRLFQFFRFAGLSGAGWVADFCIFTLLVGQVGTRPFYANILSSSIAALTVFTISRRFVFANQPRRLGSSLLVYWMYTMCVIVCAAWCIQQITGILADISLTHAFSKTGKAALAKIFVTPPQLLLNFYVARFLIERPLRST